MVDNYIKLKIFQTFQLRGREYCTGYKSKIKLNALYNSKDIS